MIKVSRTAFLFRFFTTNVLVFGILGCQTRPTQTVLPPGDPWFASARLGDWTQLEQLQKKLNRPWDFQGPSGVTALMIAARNGHLPFISKLLGKKVVINRVDSHGYNALSYALHGPASEEAKVVICHTLIENGADPFSEDQFRVSGILVMIELGFRSCIERIKFSDFRSCDQQDRLTEVTSLVEYADKEDEFEIRDFLKAKGCK